MTKILLIEDNMEMRENTAEILELSNYEVITAANGKEGIEKAKKELPHLIICDIMMPELDGYGVLRVLGKLPETAGIPFIFLTAKSEKEDFRKGMSMGADDYLTKPFDDVELLDIIELRLRKNQIARKEYSNDVDGIADFMNDAKALNELSHLSADRTIRKFKKKEIIFYEGNLPHGLFFVNSGKAKTYKTNDDGKEYITGLFKEGDFIGYIDLLQNSNYTESAMAMEDSEICLIPKQDFYKLLNSNRDVSIRFIKMISNNLVEMEERILKLAYNSVRKRVAEALVMLEDKFKEKNEGEEFNMNIPREDLANIVGTAPESVIRTLSDFKDEKLIEIKGSNIKITNSASLRKMRN
jgi:CRP/FNR family transcriptional regulator, polysaccharide utilization system transcription regulator